MFVIYSNTVLLLRSVNRRSASIQCAVHTAFALHVSARTIKGLQGLGEVPVLEQAFLEAINKSSHGVPVPPDADSRNLFYSRLSLAFVVSLCGFGRQAKLKSIILVPNMLRSYSTSMAKSTKLFGTPRSEPKAYQYLDVISI